MLNEILLNIIIILHLIYICFIVITPFTNSNYFLLLHSIFVPFMLLHWIMNENICVLTLLEKNIRKKIYGKIPDSSDCFTCQLIEPVFDLKKNCENYSTLLYGVSIGLWIISVSKLYYKYKQGEITEIRDLFIM